MNDRELENLLRMVAEVDELDRAARRADEMRRDVAATIPFGAARGRHWLSRLGVPAAAVAALVLAWVGAPSAPERPGVVCAPGLEILHWPGDREDDGARIDCFEPTPSERCVVLAIFHAWQPDCQCLEWQLYKWEDGRPLTELTPDEVRDITLDVTGAPPVEQLLVVVIAKDPRDLPGNDTQAFSLLDCLNDVEPATDAWESTTAYASAVQACLPASVRVVPRSFFVE